MTKIVLWLAILYSWSFAQPNWKIAGPVFTKNSNLMTFIGSGKDTLLGVVRAEWEKSSGRKVRPFSSVVFVSSVDDSLIVGVAFKQFDGSWSEWQNKLCYKVTQLNPVIKLPYGYSALRLQVFNRGSNNKWEAKIEVINAYSENPDYD